MVSVLAPVFNEHQTVPKFLKAVVPVLDRVCSQQLDDGRYEIVFIDDGSVDGTVKAVTTAAKLNPNIKLIRFSRNFGKEAALAAGLRYSIGDCVIPMDVDLQDPPEVIPLLVTEWLGGAEVVNAIRRQRDRDTWFKRTTARIFYKIYNGIADLPIKSDVGDFRLLDRQVVDALNQLSEGSRFTKALYSWVGYVNKDIAYDRAERAAGETKWGFGRLFRFAFDGIIASTTIPLRIWSYIGFFIAFLAFLYGPVIVAKTLLFGIDTPGYASLMVVILFLGGLNLLSLGILGEYVGRIAQELRHRPLYLVRETYGIGSEISHVIAAGPVETVPLIGAASCEREVTADEGANIVVKHSGHRRRSPL